MTPVQAILAKLFVPVDADRVQKAKAMAVRQRVEWQAVMDLMTPEQRAAVKQTGAVGED